MRKLSPFILFFVILAVAVIMFLQVLGPPGERTEESIVSRAEKAEGVAAETEGSITPAVIHKEKEPAAVQASPASSATAEEKPREGAGFAFRGIVKDKQSQRPIAGVEVEQYSFFFLTDATALPEQRVETNEAGEFELQLPGRLAFIVKLMHAGHATVCHSFNLQLSAPRQPYVFHLEQGSSICGTVKNEEQAAVVGATVGPVAREGFLRVARGGDRWYFSEAVSDGEGKFCLQGLAPGSYDFAVAAQGYVPEFVGGIPAGTAGLEVVLTQGEGGEIAGRLIGKRSQTPIGSKRLLLQLLRGGPSFSRTTSTDQAGGFRFINLPAGMYALVVQQEDALLPLRFNLELASGEKLTDLTFAFPEGVVLKGTVVEKDGEKAVEGIRVVYYEFFNLERPQRNVVTDAEGKFVFQDVRTPSGRVMLGVKGKNYVLESSAQGDRNMLSVYIEPEAVEKEVTLEVVPGLQIKGKVTDAEGEAVGDAIITYRIERRVGEGFFKNVFTDPAGEYELVAQARVGEKIVVIARHDAYGMARSRPQLVSSLEEPVEVDLQFGGLMGISGRVVTQQAETVAGAEVELASRRTRLRETRSAVSDEAGEFSFTEIPEGRYSLQAAHEEFGICEPRTFQLREEPVENIELVLTPGVSLTGIVVNEETEPVEGAQIRAVYSWGTGRGIKESYSDSEGRFTLETLPSRKLSLRVSHQEYRTKRVGEKEIPDEGEVRIVLSQRVQVEGRVINRADGSVVTHFTIVPHRLRKQQPPFPARWLAHEFSSEEGEFSFSDLPAGRFAFQAIAEMVGVGTSGEVAVVEAPEEPALLSIELEPFAHLRGQVVDAETGEGVGGCQVTLGQQPQLFSWVDEGVSVMTETSAQGEFVLSPTLPGKHRLYVSHPDYQADYSEPIELAPGEETEVVVELPYGGNITGVVVDREGNPWLGAELELSGPLRRERFAAADAEGKYGFDKLRAGEYQLSLLLSRGASLVVARIKLATNEGKVQDVDMTGWVKVNGEASSGEQPLANHHLTLTLQNSPLYKQDLRAEVEMNENGKCMVTLPPGDFRARAARKKGQEFKGRQVTIPHQPQYRLKLVFERK